MRGFPSYSPQFPSNYKIDNLKLEKAESLGILIYLTFTQSW